MEQEFLLIMCLFIAIGIVTLLYMLNKDVRYISNDKHIECYDIEPTKSFIIKQDTIKHPPNYNNKYIITNPPYLARNKCTNKLLFDKYDVNDLYKCLIKLKEDANKNQRDHLHNDDTNGDIS